jgi:DNA-binding transcriptional ArsR family regulator
VSPEALPGGNWQKAGQMLPPPPNRRSGWHFVAGGRAKLDNARNIHIFEYMNIKTAHAPAMPTQDLLAKATQAAAFLRSLAHEHRLAILCALEEGPRHVGELAAQLGMAQPKVSQHLAILKSQGLVAATRRGTSIEYRADSETARLIVAALQAEFCPPIATRGDAAKGRNR